MPDSMQIIVLEKLVYDLEETMKKFQFEINEKVSLQEEKIKRYEEFLRGFAEGSALPKKVEKEHRETRREKKIKRYEEFLNSMGKE